MQVTATAKGYFGSLREPGDTFEVPKGTTGSWFQPVPVAQESHKDARLGKPGKPSHDDQPDPI